MQLINTQYKVINISNEDNYGSTVIVEDMLRGHLLKKLRIINLQRETEEFIEYMKANLYDYWGLWHPNLAEFYFFNKVTAIDTKPVVANKFYLTYEYFNGEVLFDFARDKDFNTILELMTQLCAAIKFLHLRGFLLCTINPDELVVTRDGGKNMLKITATPYIDGTDRLVMFDKNNNYFKSPEAFQYGKYSRLSDIYLIGAVMLHAFSREKAESSNFREALAKFRTDDDPRLEAVKEIIRKCTELKPTDRYTAVEQIVEDINKKLSTDFNIIDKNYIQKLPSHMTKLVSRESHIRKILSNVKGRLFEDKPVRVTVVKGGMGTGKATFLKNLSFRLEQEGIKVYTNKLHEEVYYSFYLITSVIKGIIRNFDKEFIDKYASDISLVVPEIGGNASGSVYNSVLKQEDKVRLIYRLGNFLLEAANKYPFAITVSGFEWADEDSLSVLNYVLKSENKGKIYLIPSIDIQASEENSKFSDLYNSLFAMGYADHIELSNFNINETAEYIRLLLGTDKAPLDFAANIYKETEGNPKYIYEIMNLLFSRNYIYVNDAGEWVLTNIDFNNINLSFNIDEIALIKLSKLDVLQNEVLRVISIFSTAVSSDILEEMLNINNEKLYELLNKLDDTNILSRKVDDWGISYDFSSINLKKSLYEKIPSGDKLEYHKKASFILERKFEKENRENKDELIYHMTKANRLEDAINQLMSSAEKMISSNLLSQAVQFLEQTYSLLPKDVVSDEKIEVCLRLGDLYEQLGSFIRSLYFYEIAENILIETKESKLLCDVYVKKSNLLYRMGDKKGSIEYAMKAKRTLKGIDYPEGLYELAVNLYDLMSFKRKYSSYIGIMETILASIDREKYKCAYARLLSSYGRQICNKGRYEEGFPMLMQSVGILEELGAYKYLPAVLNNIGVVYTDYFNDMQKSREYYEKSILICQKTNDLYIMEKCYNNHAETYRIEDKYKEAIEYYNKALDVVRVSQNLTMKTLLYINMITVCTCIEDYKRACDYINSSEDLLNNIKDSGNFNQFYYQYLSEFYYEMGYNELAREYSQKAVDMCISWGITENLEAKLVAILSEIKLSDAVDYQREMGFVQRVYAENLYKLGRAACVRFVHIYTDKGLKQQAEQFFQLGLSYRDKIETDVLKYEYLYAEAVMEEDPAIKLEKLLSLIEQMDLIESNEMKYRICYGMAMELKNRGDKYEALRYLISALNYLRRLVYNVPDEYKVKFVMSHGRNRVREELVGISSGIKAANGIKEEEEDRRETMNLSLMSMDKYFDYTEFRDIYRYKELEGRETEKAIDIEEQGRSLRKIQELVGKFTEDDIGNLKHAISLLAEITQAKTAFIAVLEEDNSMEILASYNRYTETPFYKYIIEQAKQKKSSIMINDVFEYSRKKGDILIPKEITALFCIPITAAQTTDGVGIVEEKRRNKETGLSQIVGYIYLDTDSIINNFTEESGKFCSLASKVIYILVDNYNLKIVSTVDKLTKLYTRKYFETALQNEMAYVEREGGEFSIIMIDIDRFKTVNDRFGHQKGDEVLQNVSSIIMGAVRKGDICGRYGGEEIIIMLPSTNSRDGLNVAEKIRKKIENARLLGLHTPLTVSLGVSSYPEHSTWIKDLIEKADQALYYAKESGRNMSCMYQGNMSKSVKRIDKLAGIISGNQVEDQRRVETMLEILELQRSIELSHRDKVYNFLGRVIEVSEAQTGILFYIEEGNKISGRLIRKKLLDVEVGEAHYNESLVYKCMESRQGEYQLDWSGYPGVDTVTGMPDWQSVMVVPLTNKGELRGVLYLTVSMKNREYDAESYNYIKTLCDIMASVL